MDKNKDKNNENRINEDGIRIGQAIEIQNTIASLHRQIERQNDTIDRLLNLVEYLFNQSEATKLEFNEVYKVILDLANGGLTDDVTEMSGIFEDNYFKYNEGV